MTASSCRVGRRAICSLQDVFAVFIQERPQAFAQQLAIAGITADQVLNRGHEAGQAAQGYISGLVAAFEERFYVTR